MNTAWKNATPINGLDEIYAFTTALRNAAKQYTEESIETP